MWTVGRVYSVRDKLFAKPEGKILILRRFGQRLGDVTEEDARKEGFSSKEEFREAWTAIYGSWNPEQIVTAYEFKLLKAGTPRLK